MDHADQHAKEHRAEAGDQADHDCEKRQSDEPDAMRQLEFHETPFAAHNIAINFARNENKDTTVASASFAVAWT